MRRIINVLAALLVAPLVVGGASPAPSVVVTIQGVQTATGVIYVSLCRKEEFMTPKCYQATGRRIAKAGSYIISFKSVEPGLYAVLAWHDVNGNKVLDRNGYGAPTEPTGVSGTGTQAGQLPQFARSSFTVSKDTVPLSIRLR